MGEVLHKYMEVLYIHDDGVDQLELVFQFGYFAERHEGAAALLSCPSRRCREIMMAS